MSVAVRFYDNLAFRRTDANQAFAQAVVQHLADSLPVVLLNTSVNYDRKHSDFPLDVSGDVTYVAEYRTLAMATFAKPHLGGYWAGPVDEITPEAVAEMILASRQHELRA